MRIPTSARTRLPRLITAATCMVAAWGLVACGSATVEDSGSGNEQTGTATSVAPLERDSHSAEKESASEDSGSESASQSAESKSKESSSAEPSKPAAAGGATSDGGGEQGAREVDDVPEPNVSVSQEDQRYLDFLEDKKIDTKGVEAQVTGAGVTVCHDDSVTLPAVAGQLIEQGRTDMKHEELVRVMTDEAKDAYC